MLVLYIYIFVFACVYVYIDMHICLTSTHIVYTYAHIHREYIPVIHSMGFEYFLYRFPIVFQNWFFYILIFHFWEEIFFSPYKIAIRMRSTNNGICRKIIRKWVSFILSFNMSVDWSRNYKFMWLYFEPLSYFLKIKIT